MTDLTALIRLHKWRVDEAQRALADLRTMQEGLVAQRQALEQEIAQEQAAAHASEDAAFIYPAYHRAAMARLEDIEAQIRHAQKRIGQATDDLALAFQHLKRIELTQERRQAETVAEQKRRENAVFDEHALIVFERNRHELERE